MCWLLFRINLFWLCYWPLFSLQHWSRELIAILCVVRVLIGFIVCNYVHCTWHWHPPDMIIFLPCCFFRYAITLIPFAMWVDHPLHTVVFVVHYCAIHVVYFDFLSLILGLQLWKGSNCFSPQDNLQTVVTIIILFISYYCPHKIFLALLMS